MTESFCSRLRDYSRCLFFIPFIYLTEIVGNNVVTVRTAQYINYLVQNSVVGPDTKPLPYVPTPFILRDLGFDLLSPAPSLDEVDRITVYLNFVPLFFISVFLLLTFRSASRLRIVEYIVSLTFLICMNFLLHIFTTLPDSTGLSNECTNPEHQSAGIWEWTSFELGFCGDQLFSAHTLHSLTALIMIRRSLLYDFPIKTPSPPWSHVSISTWIFNMLARAGFFVFCVLLIYARFHYSIDLILAICLVWLVTTNRPLLVWGVGILFPRIWLLQNKLSLRSIPISDGEEETQFASNSTHPQPDKELNELKLDTGSENEQEDEAESVDQETSSAASRSSANTQADQVYILSDKERRILVRDFQTIGVGGWY